MTAKEELKELYETLEKCEVKNLPKIIEMNKRLINGITLALRKAFPDSMITSNEVKQGLNVPAFIVRMVSFQTQAHPMQRHKNLPRFDIIYFPKADREECYSVSDKLCKVLEVIALPSGDKVRGVDMSSEITDDALHFFISYNHFVYAPYYDTTMDELKIKQGEANAQTLYAYRINGGGAKAANTFCTAKYTGTAGNKLYVVIAANADSTSMFDVSLYYDTTLLDAQTVAAATALKDNDFVTWKTNATLEVTTKTALSGGTNGTANAAAHQAALDKFESYSFNTLGCPTDDTTTAKLYMNYTKRMRDEVGAKFQTVIFNLSANAKIADYEGVIEVASKAADYPSNVAGIGQYALVYWVTGASAGCAVNKSNTNKKYDGELSIDVDKTQADLAADIEAGRFVMHNVNGDVRVLEDPIIAGTSQ